MKTGRIANAADQKFKCLTKYLKIKTMLFDKQTGIFNLDEQVQNRASFQKIMMDQIVTDDEVEEQSQLVIRLLKELEANLSTQDLEKVSDVLVELGVLYAVSQMKQIQDIHR
jgi:hypothetical protein